MSLVKEIIKDLLPEKEKRTIAVYGGGFKPPTSGHFEVVKTAIKKNPNIDKFIILIGGKERDGVTPEESILIWDIYKQYLPINIEIKLSSKPPIQAVYNYAKEHPDEDVIFRESPNSTGTVKISPLASMITLFPLGDNEAD